MDNKIKNKNKIIPTSEFAFITTAVDKANEYTNDKFKQVTWLMVGVVIVCFIGFITLIVDSFHINSITYKDYSKKLDQYNKNQEVIIDLQEQILNKKNE